MVASAPQFGLSNDDLDVLFDLFFLQRNVFKRESTRIIMFNYSRGCQFSSHFVYFFCVPKMSFGKRNLIG